MTTSDDEYEITESRSSSSLNMLIIKSVDTLRGSEIHQQIPIEWNGVPPMLLSLRSEQHQNNHHRPGFMASLRGGGNNGSNNNKKNGKHYEPSLEEMERLLKGMIRLGIPPALRCAVWLSNIIQAVHPEQNSSYWFEYRTLAKVRALDYAYDNVLEQIICGTSSGLSLLSKGTTNSSEDSHGENNNNSPREDNPYHNQNYNTLTDKHQHQQQQKDIEDDNNNNNNSDNNTYLINPDDIWNTMEASKFGRSTDDGCIVETILPSGELAQKRVLIALERILGMDYAPLIPNIASILLSCMSESYTFCAIREMAHQAASWYFPVSEREHAAWCCAFGDILRKLHPSTAEYLEDRGVLDVDGLIPIFQDFWVGILPFQYVQRIMDIYTLEGSKVLFRFGVAINVLYKIESAENLITISNADEWWHTMKNWAYSKRFNFDLVVRKAYGVHGRGIRRQMRFPRRSIIQRIIRMEENRLRHDGMENESLDSPTRPLGLVHRPPHPDGTPAVKPILAEPHAVRMHLAKWLPITLRVSNLDLLYSTNSDGRTLERFYSHVRNAKHTILICEVLRAENDPEPPVIIGMYASQAWRASTRVYGDGGVFLFRLSPEPICWKWHPERPSTGGSILDHVDVEDDDNNNNHTALMEQFMVATDLFISMGGNPDGSCGLRLNEDLTRGESSTAVGFDNEPLHGLRKGSVFEIGLLEVYGLVRQIDGKAI